MCDVIRQFYQTAGIPVQEEGTRFAIPYSTWEVNRGVERLAVNCLHLGVVGVVKTTSRDLKNHRVQIVPNYAQVNPFTGIISVYVPFFGKHRMGCLPTRSPKSYMPSVSTNWKGRG